MAQWYGGSLLSCFSMSARVRIPLPALEHICIDRFLHGDSMSDKSNDESLRTIKKALQEIE